MNTAIMCICWAYIGFCAVCIVAAIMAYFDFTPPKFGRKERTTDEK